MHLYNDALDWNKDIVVHCLKVRFH